MALGFSAIAKQVAALLVLQSSMLLVASAKAQTASSAAVEIPALLAQGAAGIGRPVDAMQSHRVLLVSVPDRRLVVLEGDEVIATFPIAVGAASSPSPEGEFKIVTRVEHPTYYHEGTVIPPGKDNPVGTRWIGLNRKGYGIHGTNAPRSIGRASSHGCIRLRNRDVEQLFGMLQIGDVVRIRSERDEQIAQIFGLDADEPAPPAESSDAVAGGQ